MAPDSVTVPEPVFETPPVPASAAPTVPADSAKAAEEDSVPFWIAPLVNVTPPFWVWLVPPRSSVPPDTVIAFEMAPSVPLPESCKVPALTVVPPR